MEVKIIVPKFPNGIAIGEERENLAVPVVVDYTAWVEQHGAGALQILLQRPQDADPYPVTVTNDNGEAVWTPNETDMNFKGRGEIQLVYTAGGVIERSPVIMVISGRSLVAAGDPPDPFETWLEELTELAAETLVNAQSAEDSASEANADALRAAQSALDAEAAKTGAETASTTAGQSATLAGEKAAQAAQSAQTAAQKATAAQTAATAAGASADRAETAAETAEAAAAGANQAKTDAQTAASAAAASASAAAGSAADAAAAVTEVETKGAEQITAINQAGATQIAAVDAAGAAQVQAIEDKGEEVIASIPSDYTELADEVSDLKSSVNDIEDQTGFSKDLIALAQTGGAIKYQDGTPYTSYAAITDNYTFSDFIPVKSGEKINYYLRAPVGYCMIAFYTQASTSGYVQNKSMEGTGGAQSGQFVIESDGYVRITVRNGLNGKTALLGKTGTITESINALKNDSAFVNENVFSLMAQKVSNGFLTTSGTITSNANYRVTDFYPVMAGDNIEYSIGHATTLPIICFYSERDVATCITAQNVMGKSGYTEGTFTAQTDGYVRFAYYYTSTNSYVIFNRNIPDNIKQYIDSKSQKNVLDGMNILCLGDSIFGNDGEIPVYLTNLTGANVINGAVGGTRVTNRGGSDSYQWFDGVNLASALVSGDWTNQEAAVAGSLSAWRSRLDTLEAVNLNEIDLITMDWGTNDYAGGLTIDAIKTAYTTVINTIQQAHPSIRFLIITPIWRYFGQISDDSNGDNYKYNDATLKEIAAAIDEHAKDMRVEELQMYQKMPLNYNTASLYFDSGSTVHLNATGNLVYAHILAGKLRSMY